MLERLQEFQKSHEDAMESIKSFMKPGQYSPAMDGLVRWMLETDANPYGYLPEGWAGALSSAEAFHGLLCVISHALYDDGDITFVTVNGEPRISFVWRNEDNFRELVLTDQEKRLEKEFSSSDPYEVEVLNITPNEFGPLYDEYTRTRRYQWSKFKKSVCGL